MVVWYDDFLKGKNKVECQEIIDRRQYVNFITQKMRMSGNQFKFFEVHLKTHVALM